MGDLVDALGDAVSRAKEEHAQAAALVAELRERAETISTYYGLPAPRDTPALLRHAAAALDAALFRAAHAQQLAGELTSIALCLAAGDTPAGQQPEWSQEGAWVASSINALSARVMELEQAIRQHEQAVSRMDAVEGFGTAAADRKLWAVLGDAGGTT